MSGGVGVLSSEGGTESVAISQGTAVVFNVELSTDCEEGWLPEQVFFIVDGSLFKGQYFLILSRRLNLFLSLYFLVVLLLSFHLLVLLQLLLILLLLVLLL